MNNQAQSLTDSQRDSGVQNNIQPVETKKLDKEIFLAEYNSLRTEILQRVSQQTSIKQIAITAWGVILAYALQVQQSDQSDNSSKNYSDVFLLLVYPLLAYFISTSWTFNNMRICQIGSFLRNKEVEASKDIGELSWENHIHQLGIKHKFNSSKINHGLALFAGTQAASLIVAAILLITNHFEFFNTRPSSWHDAFYLIIILLLADIIAIWYTYTQICKSEV